MKISFQILLLSKVFNLMRFSLICFAFFGFHQLYCQTFTAEPGVLLEKSINLNAANECYIHFEDNNSIDSLYLKWRLVESSIPPGWTIDLCDYGTCYIGIPSGKKMQPAPDTVQPYLKLLASPGNIPGEAWLWFRVTNVYDPADFLDVYYDLFTLGITGTNAQQGQSERVFFPNPVSDFLFSNNTYNQAGNVQILGIDGRVYYNGPLTRNTPIDVKSWPTGSYIFNSNDAHQLIMVSH